MTARAALRLVRDDQDDITRPPEVDLLKQWAAYMTACGCTQSTIRTYRNAVGNLARHAEVSDMLDLRREHVVAWLGRPIALWAALEVSRAVENAVIVFIVCDRGDRYLSTGVFPA